MVLRNAPCGGRTAVLRLCIALTGSETRRPFKKAYSPIALPPWGRHTAACQAVAAAYTWQPPDVSGGLGWGCGHSAL